MYQTVIFSDKPALSRNMAPALATLYDPATTLVVHLMLAGPGRFAYRRGVALSEYPLISTPAYRLDPEHAWLATPLHALLSGTRAPVDNSAAVAAVNCFPEAALGSTRASAPARANTSPLSPRGMITDTANRAEVTGPARKFCTTSSPASIREFALGRFALPTKLGTTARIAPS